MLTYNTQLKRLALPEYGRNIQKMVDHCRSIADRDERTQCAHTIVQSMLALFPALKETEESRHKVWDHLAIMADFQLDIDWPYETPNEDRLHSLPEKLDYATAPIHRRHYGHLVEGMIARAAAMEPGEERDALIMLVANHMKKLLLAVNPDGVDDAKIFKDLAEYSHGEIRLDPAETHLHEFNVIAPPTGKKKKKK